MAENLSVVLIKPKEKAPFSHKNVYTGIKEAFCRRKDLQVRCYTIDEIMENKDLKPDWFFGIAANQEIPYYKYLMARSKLAVWLLEDPYEIDLTMRISGDAHVVFTNDQSGVITRYRLGYRNIYCLPLATNRTIFKPKEKDAKHHSDILIVGVAYPYRAKIAKDMAAWCKDRNLKLRVVGWWWDRIKCECLQEYAENKIINEWELSSYYNSTQFAVEINRNMNVHNKWRRRALTPSRGFLSCSCRTFTFTTERPHLNQYFEKEKEIETFTDSEELQEKILFYIENREKTKAIAEAGYRRVMSEHTYDHRVNYVLEVMGNNK